MHQMKWFVACIGLLCLLVLCPNRGATAQETARFFDSFGDAVSVPHTQVTLSSKMDENIAEVEVEEGQRVEEGDLLVRFDDRVIQARIAMEEAAADYEARIATARTRRDYYRREYERTEKLQKGRDISESKVDEYFFQMKSAELELAELQRKRVLSERQLQYYRTQAEDYRVRCPIGGVISHVWIEPREMAEVGEDLVEVIDPNVIEVRARPLEDYTDRVRPGQKALIEFPAAGDREFTGEVSVVAPYVDSSSGTFLVKVLVEPDTEAVKPGMECRVKFLPPAQ